MLRLTGTPGKKPGHCSPGQIVLNGPAGAPRMESKLHVDILTQPDDSTCGPTCLHAVYRYYGEQLPLQRVIEETAQLEDGGTLAVLLGCSALERGYEASIYTYNLQVFDPSWFAEGSQIDIAAKLRAQLEAKHDAKLRTATKAYLRFLRDGGRLNFEDLTTALIRRYLKRGVPILTGLSATYLYRSRRELAQSKKLLFDDVRGVPMGHFVVLCGYNATERTVLIADPWGPAEVALARQYWVNIDRVLNAILLGILTYDANLLVIRPTRERADNPQSAS